MAGCFWHYRQTAQSAASAITTELESSQQNNDDQAQQIEQLTHTTTALQADLERLNALDAEIRHIVNNEDPTTPAPAGVVYSSGPFKGQGGPEGQPDIRDVNKLASALQSEAVIREQSLTELKQEVLARQARLAATPSMWPAGGDITSRFGWRNSPWGAGSDFHPGIDIANNAGTPIFATADGVVVQAGPSGGYGNLVQIDHGNGIATLYGHNSLIAVSVGQTVKKGQIISYMGSTGNSTGPHVHYEIRVNGTAVNPESFLTLK
jgi:murein DD-endopeptidase MepM/ murein hydrolase activator NlpD